MVKKKQSVVPKSAERSSVPEVQPIKRVSGWDAGKIIWGLVFVALGTLLLLDNFNVINIHITDLWRLWPLLIIIAGVSLLVMRGWASVVLTLLASVLIVGLIVMTAVGGMGDSRRERPSEAFSIARSSEEVKLADVNIGSGAGLLTIGSHPDSEIVRGVVKSSSATLERTSVVQNGVQKVDLSLDNSMHWWRWGARNELAVTLGKWLPVSLNVDAGASEIRADLEEVQARSIDIDSGASSIWVKLGRKQPQSSLGIDTGASSIEIYVPKDAAVRLDVAGGLSSTEVPSDIEKISDGKYQTAGYDDADRKIAITVNMGVSSLKLNTY